MPNPTTNYGWAVPVVGGSNGSWGTILNAVFDAIDSAVHAVDALAQATTVLLNKLAGENLNAYEQWAGFHGYLVALTGATVTRDVAGSPTVSISAVNGQVGKYRIPLGRIPAGLRITGFKVQSLVPTAAPVSGVATLWKASGPAGVLTAIGTGLALTKTGTTNSTLDTKAGLSEDPAGNEEYFIEVVFTYTGSTTAQLDYVQPVLARP